MNDSALDSTALSQPAIPPQVTATGAPSASTTEPPDAEDTTLYAADGLELAATVFPPHTSASDPASDPASEPATVLVAPATAVRRSLYREFAKSLQARGFRVVTWDWRGTGDSRPASLRGFRATMAQWAELDFAGILDEAEARWPGSTLLVVGHSFGGQSFGLVPGFDRVRAAVTVASQEGWVGHWPLQARWRYRVLWRVVVPVLTRLLGYFPGRRLGVGEDLPAGVARQWARWCSTEGYLGSERGWDGHRRVTLPIDAFAFSDDPYAPRPAVDALHAHYGSDISVVELTPADLGVRRVGHFGMFKPGTPALWQRIAEILERHAVG